MCEKGVVEKGVDSKGLIFRQTKKMLNLFFYNLIFVMQILEYYIVLLYILSRELTPC